MSSEILQSRLHAARELYQAGNYIGAERLLGEALAVDPEYAPAHCLLALVHYQRKRGTAALDSANRAIGLAPTADAFRAKALALKQLKRKAESLEAARAAVAAGPTDAYAHLMLGTSLEDAKRIGEAESAFRAAASLAADDVGILADLGRFFLRHNRFAEAEAVLAEIGGATDDGTVLLLRGELALRRGRTEEARQAVLWLLSQDAANANGLRLLTQVKAAQSAFLGLWWRYASFIAMAPWWKKSLLLAPLAGLVSMATGGLGLIVILIYLRIGTHVFNTMLKNELKTVQLKKDF